MIIVNVNHDDAPYTLPAGVTAPALDVIGDYDQSFSEWSENRRLNRAINQESILADFARGEMNRASHVQRRDALRAIRSVSPDPWEIDLLMAGI